MNGPNPERENTLPYLKEALATGYDVEVDVWLLSAPESKSEPLSTRDALFLGHDKPLWTDEVPLSFLRDSRVWVHCKNMAAFRFLKQFPDIKCFIQNNDDSISPVTGCDFIWVGNKCNFKVPDFGIENNYLFHWDGVNENYPGWLSGGVYSDYVGNVPISDLCMLPFDLLVIDIDGVMTDGTKTSDRDYKIVTKSYCDLDFTAIKRFVAAGVKVCFLSGDKVVNENMAKARGVPFHSSELGVDKVTWVKKLEDIYKVKPSRMCVVGDDYYDIGLMSHVGKSACPSTSPNIVKRTASVVLPCPAGKGVIAALYDHYEKELPCVYPIDSPDVNPK